MGAVKRAARVDSDVHAHAFRHAFATVAAKMGWNEHLRVAMGHSDYGVLRRYVRLATERDLGSRADWVELIAGNPALEDVMHQKPVKALVTVGA